jgi:ribosomal protein S18 acetylase RimI-like enzyme
MSSGSIEIPCSVIPSVSFRPVVPEDEGFLFELYASTREEELAAAGWDSALRSAFLRQQFSAQQAHYRSSYPNGEHQVILLDDHPIGQIFVSRGDHEIHLTDIAFTPHVRGRGIGTALIGDLLREAGRVGVPVRLHLFVGNHRARRLYERLGFVPIGGADLYLLMEWRPGTTSFAGDNL